VVLRLSAVLPLNQSSDCGSLDRSKIGFGKMKTTDDPFPDVRSLHPRRVCVR
jgi:hypothetical protein